MLGAGNSDAPDHVRVVDAAQSLLVIVPSPPADLPDYREFVDKVNKYNKEAPFLFPNPMGHKKSVRDV